MTIIKSLRRRVLYSSGSNCGDGKGGFQSKNTCQSHAGSGEGGHTQTRQALKEDVIRRNTPSPEHVGDETHWTVRSDHGGRDPLAHIRLFPEPKDGDNGQTWTVTTENYAGYGPHGSPTRYGYETYRESTPSRKTAERWATKEVRAEAWAKYQNGEMDKSGLPAEATRKAHEDRQMYARSESRLIPGNDRSSDPGVMIALHLPMGVARKVSLSSPGAESPSSLHITLAYLGRLSKLGEGVSAQQATIAKVANILRAVGGISRSLSGSITGVGRFTGSESSDGKDVIYAGVDVPGLVELRHRICQSLKAFGIPYSQDHGFTPHVTLAYVEPGEASPVARIPSHPVSFGSVALTIGDDRQSFPLTGRTEYERKSGTRPMPENLSDKIRRILYCKGDVACSPCAAEKAVAADHIAMNIVPDETEAEVETPKRFTITRGAGGKIRISYAASQSTPLKSVGGKLVSARSKSGSPACSQAASDWRTGRADKSTYVTLAQCRAQAATKHAAKLHSIAGNEGHAQHLEHIAASTHVTKKDRASRAAELRGQHNAELMDPNSGRNNRAFDAGVARQHAATQAKRAGTIQKNKDEAASLDRYFEETANQNRANTAKERAEKASDLRSQRKARVLEGGGKLEITSTSGRVGHAAVTSHPLGKKAVEVRDPNTGRLIKSASGSSVNDIASLPNTRVHSGSVLQDARRREAARRAAAAGQQGAEAPAAAPAQAQDQPVVAPASAPVAPVAPAPPSPRPSIEARKARVLGKLEATRTAANKGGEGTPERRQAFRNAGRDIVASGAAKAAEAGGGGYFSKLKAIREKQQAAAGGQGASAAPAPAPAAGQPKAAEAVAPAPAAPSLREQIAAKRANRGLTADQRSSLASEKKSDREMDLPHTSGVGKSGESYPRFPLKGTPGPQKPADRGDALSVASQRQGMIDATKAAPEAVAGFDKRTAGEHANAVSERARVAQEATAKGGSIRDQMRAAVGKATGRDDLAAKAPEKAAAPTSAPVASPASPKPAQSAPTPAAPRATPADHRRATVDAALEAIKSGKHGGPSDAEHAEMRRLKAEHRAASDRIAAINKRLHSVGPSMSERGRLKNELTAAKRAETAAGRAKESHEFKVAQGILKASGVAGPEAPKRDMSQSRRAPGGGLRLTDKPPPAPGKMQALLNKERWSPEDVAYAEKHMDSPVVPEGTRNKLREAAGAYRATEKNLVRVKADERVAVNSRPGRSADEVKNRLALTDKVKSGREFANHLATEDAKNRARRDDSSEPSGPVKPREYMKQNAANNSSDYAYARAKAQHIREQSKAKAAVVTPEAKEKAAQEAMAYFSRPAEATPPAAAQAPAPTKQRAGAASKAPEKPSAASKPSAPSKPSIASQVAAKHADRYPGRLEDVRENLKLRERERRDNAIKQAGGQRTEKRGTEARAKGAEGVKALHEKRLGMERAKGQIAEQGARADQRGRAKFPLFGGQTPDERPHEGTSQAAPVTPRTSPVPGLPKQPHEMTNHELQHHHDSNPEFATAWDKRYAGSPVNPLYHSLYLQEAAHHGAKVPEHLLPGGGKAPGGAAPEAQPTAPATPAPSLTTSRPLAEQLSDIPSNVRNQVEGAARSRIGMLQRLREARFMATTESGKGAGKVDREALKGEREKRNLDAGKIKEARAKAAATLGNFRAHAPQNDVDPEAVIGHFREEKKQELQSKPQMLLRGSGYYPSGHEAAKARTAKAAAERASGDPMRQKLAEDKAQEASASAAAKKVSDEKNKRLGMAGRLRGARRGLATPPGKGGKPITPEDLKRGDDLIVPSSSGPLRSQVTSVAKKQRDLAVGGVVKRGDKYHPVRDIPRDKLNEIRGRVAARAERRKASEGAESAPEPAASPAPASPAASPSLKDQAAAKRATKGSREDRLQSLVDRSKARGNALEMASKGTARDDATRREKGFAAFQGAQVEARRSNRLGEALNAAKTPAKPGAAPESKSSARPAAPEATKPASAHEEHIAKTTDDLRGTLEKQMDREVNPRKKAMAAESVLHGENPEVQKRLAQHLFDNHPDVYRAIKESPGRKVPFAPHAFHHTLPPKPEPPNPYAKPAETAPAAAPAEKAPTPAPSPKASGRNTPERQAKAKEIRDSPTYKAGRTVDKYRASVSGRYGKAYYQDKKGVAPGVYESRKEATQAIARAHQREAEYKAKRDAEAAAERRKRQTKGMVGSSTRTSLNHQARYQNAARNATKQNAIGFKQKEIGVAAGTKGSERIPIKAHVIGDLAVHQALSGTNPVSYTPNRFAVTHVPSGLSVGHTSSLARAKQAAGAIHARKIDLAHVSKTRKSPESQKHLKYIHSLFKDQG